jgi:hypothetical protein
LETSVFIAMPVSAHSFQSRKKSASLLCLKLLVEGNSIRSTERITEVHRDTILRLLNIVGERREKIMNEERTKNIPIERIEVDEIWGLVNKKPNL